MMLSDGWHLDGAASMAVHAQPARGCTQVGVARFIIRVHLHAVQLDAMRVDAVEDEARAGGGLGLVHVPELFGS